MDCYRFLGVLALVLTIVHESTTDRFETGELKVEVLQEADDECPLRAKNDDLMYVHYKGMFLDGAVFDSSIPKNRPYTFVLGTGSVIQGYEIGLQDMCVGEKRKLTVPSQLAYGGTGYGDIIPPYATLVFEVELLKIERKKELKVEVMKETEGDCKLRTRNFDRMHVHYKGSLEDGTVFDSSIPKNQPYVFVIGTGYVIQGYEQGLLDMCEGEQRRLIVPPHLGYGERGSGKNIPPHATLIFEVELLKIDREPEELEVQILDKPEECLLKSQNYDKLHVHYTGWLWDGTEFDSSLRANTPYIFVIGTGMAIQGYEQGLLDMCEGEKRKLIVPQHLAYGEDGYPSVIPPSATLIFDVELLKIERRTEL